MASRLESATRFLRERYDSLERRDRLAVSVLSVFLVALVLYFAIWSPANEFFESRRVDRDRQFALIQLMRASEQEARAASGSRVSAPTGQALMSHISRTAGERGITPNRLQPEGADGVSVWFDGVAFDVLVAWLEEQSEQGVVVRQVSIDRRDEPGKVNARIVLRS